MYFGFIVCIAYIACSRDTYTLTFCFCRDVLLQTNKQEFSKRKHSKLISVITGFWRVHIRMVFYIFDSVCVCVCCWFICGSYMLFSLDLLVKYFLHWKTFRCIEYVHIFQTERLFGSKLEERQKQTTGMRCILRGIDKACSQQVL